MSLPYMFSHMVRAFLNWRVDQTEHYSPALMKGMINIAVNEGKRFEQNWKHAMKVRKQKQRKDDIWSKA